MFDEIAWGSAADWLTSVATVLYLLVTYLLLRHAVRAQRTATAEARRKERHAQAELVAAWCTGIARHRFSAGANAGNTCDSLQGRVRNGSNLPVYEVQVMMATTWPADGKPIDGWFIGADIPGNSRLLGPGETKDWVLLTDLTDPFVTPPVQLTFTDASSRHWKRDPYGALSEQESNQFDRRQWQERIDRQHDVTGGDPLPGGG